MTEAPQERDALIARYLPLARSVANRYRHTSESIDDLEQVAAIGLVKAVDRWNPDLGYAFSSFAVPTIAGELKRHFRDRSWAIRPGRELQELWLKVERGRDELWRTLGRSPTATELAAHLDRPVEDILEALSAGDGRALKSLDEPAGDDDGASAALGEILGQEDPGFSRVDTSVTIEEVGRSLSSREREVLRLRFQEDLTQSEIGELIGCSQMHVSRMLRQTLERLRIDAGMRDAAD
jgi:RNA polymerase sigma-B factor